MPHEWLLKQTLYAKVNEKRPVGRSPTRWLEYIRDLSLNRLRLRLYEMQSVLVEREVWRLYLELTPPQPLRTSG